MSASFQPTKPAPKTSSPYSQISQSSPSANTSRVKPGRSFADAARGGGPRMRTGGRPPAHANSSKPKQPNGTARTPAMTGGACEKAGDVLDISTGSEDEAIVLADRPLDPGDSMYRGRANPPSRIKSAQPANDRSPVQTRRGSKKVKGVPENPIAAPLTPLDSPVQINESSERSSVSRPRPKPRPVKRKKIATVVDSSDDDRDDDPPSSTTKKARLFDDRGDDLPTMGEIFQQVAQELKTAKAAKTSSTTDHPYLDTEAQESGHDGSGDEREDPRDDDYDFEDPFIDDSNHPDVWSDHDHNEGHAVRRQSNASSFAMDLDESYPGVLEDDPVDTAMKDRERRRLDHEQEMEALFSAAGRHRRFLMKALELLQSNEAPDDDLLDEDRQISLATRDSLMELLGGASPNRTTLVNDAPHQSANKKGKGKAAVVVKPDVTQVGTEDGLSDYERRDLERIREAMDISRRQPQPVVGQSSRGFATSNHSPTSTPDSKKPKVEPQPSPHTPPTRRRQKRGIADLMAAAGAEPVSPPVPTSSPPSSSPANGGLIIDSRLLAPPPVNEIGLDMSDRVIRLTAKADLYPLAQAISFKSWNENLQGLGHVRFCGWAVQCPDIDGELALAFVVFERHGDFGNLSRMDISHVYCLRLSPTATRYHAVTKEGRPFVFLTTGWLDASQITRPSPVGLKQKSIKIITHEGEHQRMSSAACTVFGFDSMKTQYAKQAVQFSTRAEFTPTTNGSASSPGGKTAPAGMFTGASSGGSARISADSFSLPNTAEVPVYDARDVDAFDVNTDLPNLDAKLPRWREEIPYGSFVVVGYTMTAFFSSSREWTLGLNIQWAIIVGIPPTETA